MRASNAIINNFEIYLKDSNYEEAVSAFESLKKLEIPISKITKFNAANCYYALKDTANATELFKESLRSPDTMIRNSAHNMLSRLALDQKDTLKAISILQDAIVNSKPNEELLYNYEFLKKKFKNNNQQAPLSSSLAEKDQMKENSGYTAKTDEKEDELKNTNPPKIDREQALKVLEALKSKEIYFIPRKGDTLKNDNKNYGNW